VKFGEVGSHGMLLGYARMGAKWKRLWSWEFLQLAETIAFERFHLKIGLAPLTLILRSGILILKVSFHKPNMCYESMPSNPTTNSTLSLSIHFAPNPVNFLPNHRKLPKNNRNSNPSSCSINAS
jgi:hypothetical protein